MMRTSNLLRWAQRNGSNKGNDKNWIHSPESLLHGHIAYLVKFLGSTDVDQPKGIEVVKEGIRKLRFSQQLRKAEGQRTPKVELTVSVDGVAIQEPKGKRILHQYPLHRISYCADDKAEKKFFSFIAKESDSEKHTCYVFVSDKLAEEITLTIGQAFDLAYRRFLETTGRELEGRRQISQLQENVDSLERQNNLFRRRLLELSKLVETNKLADFLESHRISDILEVARESDSLNNTTGVLFNNSTEGNLLVNLNDQVPVMVEPLTNLPPVPPRSFENKNGHSLVHAISSSDNLESDDDFDPRSEDTSVINNNLLNGTTAAPILSPPPIQPRGVAVFNKEADIFGAEPFVKAKDSDPFGMDDFGRLVPSQVDPPESNSSLKLFDQRLTEMREGFSRGISFGEDDFNIETLDPLRS